MFYKLEDDFLSYGKNLKNKLKNRSKAKIFSHLINLKLKYNMNHIHQKYF